MTGVADFPADTLARGGIGLEPIRQNPLGSLDTLRSRRARLEIAHPGETVHGPLESRRELGRGGEIDLRDRDFDAVDQEVTGAQSGTGNGVALERAGDRGQQPRLHRLAERSRQGVARKAETIGEAHQPLAHGCRRRLEVRQRQGPPRRDQLGRWAVLGQRFFDIAPERNGHGFHILGDVLRCRPRSGHEPIARGQFGHASPRKAAILAA